MKAVGFGVWLGIALALFFWNGCASDPDSLQLESVMDVRVREERERTQVLEAAQKAKLRVEEILKQSKLQTPEIDLLELPPSFIRYTKKELEALRSTSFESVPPFCEVLWRDFTRDITVMAGQVPIDNTFLTTQTEDRFLKTLETEVGASYDALYQKAHKSRASSEVRKSGKVIVLEVRSKYLQEKNWLTDVRYFYLYRPEYRLNVMVKGPDQALHKAEAILETSFSGFAHRLNEAFPQGVSFKEAE